MQTLNELSTTVGTGTGGTMTGFTFKSKTGRVFKAVAKSPGGKYLATVVKDSSGKFTVGEEMLLSGTDARYTLMGDVSGLQVKLDEAMARYDRLETELGETGDLISDLEAEIADIEG